ncbi:unnamed protein product [Rhizophagus irregularis]|nr:unnamed protein product [Rhizophagus irregularis]
MTKKSSCLETLDSYYTKPGGNSKNNSHPFVSFVQCNYCTKIFDQAVPSRMQVHLDKECSGAPDNTKSTKQNVGSQDSILKTTQSLPNIALNSLGFHSPLLISSLWPSFKLPNRKRLADELLDDVYDEVKMQADEQIYKAKSLCMVSNGWSNINQE